MDDWEQDYFLSLLMALTQSFIFYLLPNNVFQARVNGLVVFCIIYGGLIN